MLSSVVGRRAAIRAGVFGGQVRSYSEGSTGAPRDTQQADAFNKKEKATEDYYFHQHEAEKLQALRQTLQKAKEQKVASEQKIEAVQKEIDANEARIKNAKKQSQGARNAEKALNE